MPRLKNLIQDSNDGTTRDLKIEYLAEQLYSSVMSAVPVLLDKLASIEPRQSITGIQISAVPNVLNRKIINICLSLAPGKYLYAPLDQLLASQSNKKSTSKTTPQNSPKPASMQISFNDIEQILDQAQELFETREGVIVTRDAIDDPYYVKKSANAPPATKHEMVIEI